MFELNKFSTTGCFYIALFFFAQLLGMRIREKKTSRLLGDFISTALPAISLFKVLADVSIWARKSDDYEIADGYINIYTSSILVGAWVLYLSKGLGLNVYIHIIALLCFIVGGILFSLWWAQVDRTIKLTQVLEIGSIAVLSLVAAALLLSIGNWLYFALSIASLIIVGYSRIFSPSRSKKSKAIRGHSAKSSNNGNSTQDVG